MRQLRSASLRSRPVLKPLVVALAMALPLASEGQTRPPLPVPAAPSARNPAGWRVHGRGPSAPVVKPGGRDMVIEQQDQRGIYHWASFDIDPGNSVLFDMKQAGSSALNRVEGTRRSEIYGSLKATNGGEIYIINRNGILFGAGAKVDVGSLIASTLDLRNTDFLDGLTGHLTSNRYGFKYDGTPEDFIDSKNFVLVEKDANIRTSEGGRVFLFAKRVENAGRIETPGGQTVLAAGGEVQLKLPTSDALYAATVGSTVPALRGLLVEVARGPNGPDGGQGKVTNTSTGEILTPRGNTTLVGMAVNQLGRISATTSVSQNGSILLLAQGNTRPLLETPTSDANVALDPRDTMANATLAESYRQAQAGGTLVLGRGSVTEVLADTGVDAKGQVPTSDGNATFVASRIDLAGISVTLEGDGASGAKVIAPGANVNVRAMALPMYVAPGAKTGTYAGGDAEARVTIGRGAVIDVSGTEDTTVSAARNFVTTELLGSNDLKDSPLQKDGLLARNQVVLDVRDDSPILGDLGAYRQGIDKTAGERLASGGKVSIVAQGAVVAEEGSRIDVSGGRVNYTSALVRPTAVVGPDGKAYSLNDAPSDLVYSGIVNAARAKPVTNRWGLVTRFGLGGRLEAGYVDGQAAGSLDIIAPTATLDGGLSAGTVAGVRQLNGQDTVAAGGRLSLGATVNGATSFDVNGATFVPVLERFTITAPGAPSPAEVSRVSAAQLAAAGFRDISVTTRDGVTIVDGAVLDLPALSTVQLRTTTGDVEVAGDIRTAGGSVVLKSSTGSVDVSATLDVSGRFVNAQRDGTGSAAGIHGGSVSVSADRVLHLGEDARIDASGGAFVAASGSLSGGDGGSIALSAGNGANRRSNEGRIEVDGRLEDKLTGQAVGKGGSLSLATRSVRIGDPSDAAAEPAALNLSSAFFDQGGFATFRIDGRHFLDVTGGTLIRPEVQSWLPVATVRGAATGSELADLLPSGVPVLKAPQAVTLALSSSGLGGDLDTGHLTVGTGASIELDARSKASFSALSTVEFDGAVTAHGGAVEFRLTRGSASTTRTPYDHSQHIWLGGNSRVDVSGTTVLAPTANGLRQGEVLAGGSISVTGGSKAIANSVVWQQGSQFDVSGASGELDVTQRGRSGLVTTRQTVASAAGSISFESGRDLVLEGNLAAHGGSATSAGGSLSVALVQAAESEAAAQPAVRVLDVTATKGTSTAGQSADNLATARDLTGRASVSAELIESSGVSDLRLESHDQVRLEAGVDIRVQRELQLLARSISVGEGGAHASLDAATLRVTQSSRGELVDTTRPAAQATAGTGALRLSGDLVTLEGGFVTQGLGKLALDSRGDLRLQQGTAGENTLSTRADLEITAQQVYPATATRYTIDAGDRSVTLRAAPGTAASKPLSAGGTVVIRAGTIEQGGTIRAPQGGIELIGSGDVRLLAGSETSVSGAGLVVPGGTHDGTNWTAPGTSGAITQPPAKTVLLQAGTGGVDVRDGATVDLSAGGTVYATQFVEGPGGSKNVFSGADGAFAVVPGVVGSTPYDMVLSPTSAAPIGRQITVGEGGPLPAGTYTLLPAAYALQPGAFLVKPVASGTSMMIGTAVANADGSALVGAVLGDAGTPFRDALSGTWLVTPSTVARRSSEIRTVTADEFFAKRADAADAAVPRLPGDAGRLTIAAPRVDLQGAVRFDVPTPTADEAPGRGGEVFFSAGQIRVGSAAGAQAGVLNLTPEQLGRIRAATVVLGATAGSGDTASQLNVSASSIVVDNAGSALRAADVVLVAKEQVRLADGASVVADGSMASGAPSWTVTGDGAALRVSSDADATLVRTGATRAGGDLVMGTGVTLDAGTTGSVQLDGTHATRVAGDARITGDTVTVGAAHVVVAGRDAQAPVGADTLLLSPALSAQLANVGRLSLRSYSSIDFADGSALGSASQERLVLDAGELKVAGEATVTARDVTLQNTSGQPAVSATSGNGALTIRAVAAGDEAGHVHLAGGNQAISGVASTRIAADGGILLSGAHTLAVAGDVGLQSRGIQAEGRAEVAVTATGDLSHDAVVNGAALAAGRPGGLLSLSGRSVRQAGTIDMAGGRVTLDATGAGGDVVLAARSVTSAAGRHSTIDGVAIDLPAGTVTARSASGSVRLADGARIDVSGAAGGDAGQVVLSAAQGMVDVQGRLAGTAAASAKGGSLSIDSAARVDLAGLANLIAAGAETGRANFGESLSVRNRTGDQSVAAGTVLAARNIALSSDAGSLTVTGTLDASGPAGGAIALAAGGNLVVDDGARLVTAAREAGKTGGEVRLSSAAGRIVLDRESALIDTSGSNADAGAVYLRAAQIDTEDGVDISELKARILARFIDVEAVKVYDKVVEVRDGETTAAPPPTTPTPPSPTPPSPTPPSPTPPAPEPPAPTPPAPTPTGPVSGGNGPTTGGQIPPTPPTGPGTPTPPAPTPPAPTPPAPTPPAPTPPVPTPPAPTPPAPTPPSPTPPAPAPTGPSAGNGPTTGDQVPPTPPTGFTPAPTPTPPAPTGPSAGNGATTGDQVPPTPPVQAASARLRVGTLMLSIAAAGDVPSDGNGPTTPGQIPPRPPLPGGTPSTPPPPGEPPPPAEPPPPSEPPPPASGGHVYLGTETIRQDVEAFLGANGERALALASRLKPGATNVVVRAGVEVRSTADLKVATDWVLPAAPVDVPQVGDTSVTLRAAGNLTVAGGVSSGFVDGLARSSRGGSIRLVAGADATAADVLATRAGAEAHVLLGSTSGPAAVRSTTGRIDIASAGDIRFTRADATVYTTGVEARPDGFVDAAMMAGLEAVPGAESALLEGGGAISLKAGRDIVGQALAGGQTFITDWAWRVAPDIHAWWSRYDVFTQGIATFGGGNVSVVAGRDTRDLHASAASSGWLTADGDLHRYGGGDVRVDAGRDVVSGLLYAGGAVLNVNAGRDIASDPASGGLRLVHEDTATAVRAGGNLVLASVTGFGNAVPDKYRRDNNFLADVAITGLDTHASLLAQSAGGSLRYEAALQPTPDNLSGIQEDLVPASARFLAPNGDVTLVGRVTQQPSADGVFQVLAGASATVNAIQVNASHDDIPVSFVPRNLVREGLDADRYSHAGVLDASDRSPVRVVSETGDVTVEASIQVARSARIIAAGDVRFLPSSNLQVQHQPTHSGSELTLVQAGRDIVLQHAGNGEGIEVAGPGDLVLLAGRNIDLGGGFGVRSVGNRYASTLLAREGADVTLVAGLRADGTDYRHATKLGFAVLGGGLVARAGDLYALLSAAPDAPVAPGSGAATAFDALSTADQLQRTATLLGAESYDAAVVAHARSLPGQADLDAAAARQAFAALPDAERREAVGSLLANRFADLPAASRQAFVAAVAAISGPTAAARTAELAAYMAQVGGDSVQSADALARFEALPLERQAVLLNRVLVAEVRAAGNAAALESGDDRTAAYRPGYRAIDLLFPLDRPEGDIRLPATQVRTAQPADITLLAPGGGVDAGEVKARDSAELGIVTADGGAISSVVRDDFAVNSSRVFSLKPGDITLWSSLGNIDAGRGAKTVTGAPAPVLVLDSDGRLSFDTSGSFTGSGIAVLDAGSTLSLFAPKGEINAGDAGIKSVGGLVLAAQVVRGADNIAAGSVVGATLAPPVPQAVVPPPADPVAKTGSLEPEETPEQARRRKRQLLVDFLGFGEGR